jgi:hypothetical protein
MDEDHDERASNRLASQTLIPIMLDAFQIGLREAGSLSRWLLATLAAINGAAAISMLPVEMASGAKLGAAAAFVIGILAALGAGLWSLYVFKRVTSAAGTMLGYWLTVADDGERLRALEATMRADMDEAVGSRATLSLGAASAAAFLVGCALAGWGMFSHETADRHGTPAGLQHPATP